MIVAVKRGRWSAALVVATILTLLGCASSPRRDGGAAGTGSVVILAVNDVYRIEGIDGGKTGGLARVRTVRAELERAHPGRVLLLHGGDVIAPSFPSRMYRGEQMIDVLNLMDGDPRPGRLDERMFVVFGNHEFDAEDCARASVLQKRVAESDFYWLHSNISFTPCAGNRPRLVGANLLQGRIVEVGALKVGLFGLTIDSSKKGLSVQFLGAQETAKALVADLRRRGADLVVAVTHLNWSDDVRLYEALRDAGLDLIIGGHDHVQMRLPKDAAEPRIFKADADAETAWVVTLTRQADGRARAAGRLVKLDAGVAKDPLVDARVTSWMRRHEAEFCKAAATDPGWIGAKPDPEQCLDERLGMTETALVASEERIRSSETSGGNWVTDAMVAAFKECGVDGAFINAGALRLNQDLAAGSEITRRHLEELIGFPTALRVYTLTHAQLRRALDNAVSQPGAGRWLQVSDQIAFTYRPAEGSGAARVLKIAVRPPGRPAVDVTESSAGSFRIVADEFLQKDPTDGFDTILSPPEPAAACAASGRDLKQILYESVQKQDRIKPEEQGRICTEAESRRRACRAG
jgi:2',3'-cyclic-nucleotide 2'-phosphodiesterase (5'-nucleotidase family)